MSTPQRHIHLDPIGGIAGDMFVAALLDTFPDLEASMQAAIALIAAHDAQGRVERSRFDGFAGVRFHVDCINHPHHHRHWSDIKTRIQISDLDDAIKAHAIGIFTLLAKAEAEVHGVEVDQVHFHEVGALDSIVDIIAAAFLIDAIKAQSWSVGTLPLGGGTVQTEHGLMPVPAPATALLLQGLPLMDDRLLGERITPTGAAILAYLKPSQQRPQGSITASGMGFGQRSLPGRPNALRALAFDQDFGLLQRDQVGIIRFESDDQTSEDLAFALETLRAHPDVFDVLQTPGFGKKGRMVSGVQILVKPSQLEAIASLIFAQTTTLGIRISVEDRLVLPRNIHAHKAGVRVKIAERAGHRTAKADMDDLALHTPERYANRQTLRHQVETEILAQGSEDGGS